MVHFAARLRQERQRRLLSQEALAEALGVSPRSIRRWEQGQAVPQASVRLQLSRFFGLRPEDFLLDQESQTPPTSLWSVPYLRNPFFTGREEILSSLHELLSQEHAMALTQSVAISGLGGIGKTQIALEYAYQHRQDYHFVFWISAATREALLADFATVANLLQFPEKHESNQSRLIQAVRRWFATHQNWLLILDNADDVVTVQDFVPLERPGHLLLTSRAQALGTLAHRIEVETLGMAEGTLFLLHRAKLLPQNAFLDQAPAEHLTAAEAIVIDMAFLPLALDQAGAYIDEVGCSLSDYLELYRTHRRELLQRRGRFPTGHPEPVATTWSLSFQRVEQVNPAAADLLRLCTFLEPDTIPEELISEGCVHLGSILGPIAADAFLLNEAIEVLRRFSLVQRNSEAKLLRIHRLVQAVLKDTMGINIQRSWAERTIRVTCLAFPEQVAMATWPRCRRYLPQAQACSTLIQDYALDFEEAASLLFRTAIYLQEHALYEQAEPLYQQALSIWEQILGPGHPYIAQVLNGLATLYKDQDKYGEAEPLYQRALHIWEQALGSDHRDVAFVLNNLAELYKEQDKLEQAEALFRRALHIREQALGLEHPEVASVLVGLARLSYRQGKFDQAEPLFQRALHIQEQTFGTEHPEVASVLNNLATLYAEQSRYEQAEPLYQRALSIRKKALGLKHRDVASVLNNLAELYKEQGKLEQAEPLYKQALRIWRQLLGSDHTDVAFGLYSLAELYKEQGKLEQAEPLYKQALRIHEKTLGSEHPLLTYSLTGLASIYQRQRKFAQAEVLYQRSLSVQEQHSMSQHPNTAAILHQFAVLRETQGNTQEAAHLFQRALAIREKVLGREHPKTNETRERLQACRKR